MSGASLLILAMYSTVNVVGPSGSRLDAEQIPLLMCVLMIAAVLTCVAMHQATSMPVRHVGTEPKLPRLRARHLGPARRRA
jgi:hypothetical protein